MFLLLIEKQMPRQRLGRLCRFLDMTPARCGAFFAAKCPARKQQQLQRKTARRTWPF
jgi:hypothetical protein|tara:strand:- start:409 stop:579 length:171 start_codon:yes stop_codon:yes gene_type:complete